MRHSVFGRKFSRTKNERRRLFQGLVRDLLLRGSIRTTVAKAKAVQPLVEKLITNAKRNTESSKNQVKKVLASKDIEAILFADAKTRFAKRNSGFTRIIRLGKRIGDATEEALLTFVDPKVVAEVVKKPEVKEKPVEKTAEKPKIKRKTMTKKKV